MAISQNETITAADINNLKTAVNAEMARRKYTGSLATWNRAFTTVPAEGGDILFS